VTELTEAIQEVLAEKKEETKKLGENYPEKKSLIVDYTELEAKNPDLAEQLRKEPDNILEVFEQALNDLEIPTVIENPRFRVRFMNLPREPGYSILVREITSDFINRMISVEGVINKIGDVLPKVDDGVFICNKCGERHVEKQDTRFLREPLKCQNCERREFRFVPDASTFTDIQRLEIQEPLELLKGGEQARRIEVWTEDDMTDAATPGDKVIITGIVRLLPPKQKGSVYFKFLEANFIEGVEQEFEDIEITPEEEAEIKKIAADPKLFDKVIGSIAPSIWGYNEVKEALALQLFGGRAGKKLPDNTSVRPDMHMLLIGDPGVAKSRILQYVDQIAPKSIYMSGKGTTGAGLTATAERDEFAEGAWSLKAGALVLAGGGIAAIDEFDKMNPDDRSAMHEAMEQQTISIAKAGIVTKFKANTSVLAAANPKFSRFDNYRPLAEQFDIPPTLLSRFDLIFPIRDVLDKEADRKVADHILKMHYTDEDMADITPDIELDLLRKYIAFARRNIFPTLTKEAGEKLKEYYVSLRAGSPAGTVAATPRQLEALVRLAEASAKLRLSNEVTIADAERAINLTKFVLREIAYDETTGEFDIDRVVTDHPKSVRDRIRVIEEIISELVAEAGGGAAELADILDAAKERSIDRFEAERVIDELKKKGEVYEPRHGKIMRTEE